MASFDECIEKAKKLVEEYGEHILKVMINSAHGRIDITWTGDGYELRELEG